MLATLEPREPADFIADIGIGQGDYVVATPVNSPRSIDATTIADAASAVGATAETAIDVEEAVERATVLAGADGLVVVTGSLYSVGEAREFLV